MYTGNLNLVHDVQAFGAYFLNPIPASALVELYEDTYRLLESGSVHRSTNLYIIGFAVSTYKDMHKGHYTYRPLNSPSFISGYTFIGVTTRLHIYTSKDYSNPPVMTKDLPGILLLQKLMKVPGVCTAIGNGLPEDTIRKYLAENDLRLSCIEAKSEAKEATKKASISRDSSLDVLGIMRNCIALRMENKCSGMCEQCREFVGYGSMIEALDSAIKAQSSVTSQNKSGKYVRMADGSRRWFKIDEAQKILSLPRCERT